MPVYSDTSEGLIKPLVLLPDASMFFIYHLLIVSCCITIHSIRERIPMVLTHLSHALVLIVLAQCGTSFPFE